jgi:hypothetical protein
MSVVYCIDLPPTAFRLLGLKSGTCYLSHTAMRELC